MTLLGQVFNGLIVAAIVGAVAAFVRLLWRNPLARKLTLFCLKRTLQFTRWAAGTVLLILGVNAATGSGPVIGHASELWTTAGLFALAPLCAAAAWALSPWSPLVFPPSAWRLRRWIRRHTQVTAKRPLTFLYNGVEMVCYYDILANRMRIMVGLEPASQMDATKQTELLEDQYDSLTDVRFALKDGWLKVVFLHPLESLTEKDLLHALRELALVKQTGTGQLRFVGERQEED